MQDRRIVTWKSKQVGFKLDDLTSDTEGETDNYILCITPQSVWFLRTMLAMYGQFYNRWFDFDRDIIDQLVSQTEISLTVPLGCETDLTRIADAMEAMLANQIDQALFLTELQGINNNLANLNGTLVDLGGGETLVPFLDDIEDTLDDIGTILGIAGAVIG